MPGRRRQGASGAGSGNTLNTTYTNGAAAADQTMLVTAGAGGPVIVKANAGATGALFRTQSSGGTNLLSISDSGACTLDAPAGQTVQIGAGGGSTGVALGQSGQTVTVTGALTQLTGAVSLTANGASSLTTSSGALTLTSAAAATWSTTAGALTLTSAAATTWSTTAGALTLTSAAAATWSTTAGSLSIISGVADGGTAVGVILDTTVALANATAKPISFRSGGVEIAYFDVNNAFLPSSQNGINIGSSAKRINVVHQTNAYVYNSIIAASAFPTVGTLANPMGDTYVSNIRNGTDNTYDSGTSTVRWRNNYVYTADLKTGINYVANATVIAPTAAANTVGWSWTHTGGQGGVSGPANAAGIGGAISITAGLGGAATAGASNTSAAGGAFNLQAGTGGAAATAHGGATGGAFTVQAGSGGNSGIAGVVAGSGGTLNLLGGNAGTNVDTPGTNGGVVIDTGSTGSSTGNSINIGTTSAVSVAISKAGGQIGFFGATVAGVGTSGANVTNNVTVGGTNDTIADFTSLTVYATDAAAIRNDIYQLARKIKQVNDALRVFGLLT